MLDRLRHAATVRARADHEANGRTELLTRPLDGDDETGQGRQITAHASKVKPATRMPMCEIAFAAGFASIRRFNAAFCTVYRRSPTAVRRARHGRGRA